VFAEVNFKIDEDVVPALLADGDLCLPLVHKGHVKGKAWLNVGLDARDGSKMPWSQGSQPVVLRGAHRDGLTSCAIFPSGDRVVTVSHDGSGCVWNTKGMQSAEQVALMPGHTDTITSCKVFPSGDSIITTSLDDTCILWSSSGKQMKSIYVVGFLAVFPNGERVHLDPTTRMTKSGRHWESSFPFGVVTLTALLLALCFLPAKRSLLLRGMGSALFGHLLESLW
jgi:WD40 repeat protein